ncbi:MAG: UDP-N-acetylglucosamine--N-acetylmuramyl-(pentapeptide) pyrophosphoryl-undecaprenol N-acetylglucosamine transferase, partial [Moorea sp. SIO2I5]|nr:UDP-N-acetylglucosamine--N-acetylmuramyl-(pentapeptide) pyrophosphoryl-undecaprenol N-acetylglucosamine transferase [Moorena sp. SIO2I5]
DQLTHEILEQEVLALLKSPTRLEQMKQKAASLAIRDSGKRLASLVRELVER